MPARRHDEIRFLVLGDWGRRGEPLQRAVARGLADVAGRLGAEFVVTTGDNFYDDGVRSVEDPQWRTSFEDVYHHPSLQVPWYPSLGNHDWRGEVRAQIEYSLVSSRWRLPHRFHAFDWRRGRAAARFLVLDTTPLLERYHPAGVEEIPAVTRVDPHEQIPWLAHHLESERPGCTVVVGHHPVFSGSDFHGGARELDRTLRPLLERYGVDLYLCGHEHDLQHLQHGGVQYVLSGAGAETRETGSRPETVFAEATAGFASVCVDPDSLTVRFHDQDGVALHEHRRDSRRLVA